MWGLFVVILFTGDSIDSKVAGSYELKFKTKDECVKAQEKTEKYFTIDNYRLHTSCTFKGYLR